MAVPGATASAGAAGTGIAHCAPCCPITAWLTSRRRALFSSRRRIPQRRRGANLTLQGDNMRWMVLIAALGLLGAVPIAASAQKAELARYQRAAIRGLG